MSKNITSSTNTSVHTQPANESNIENSIKEKLHQLQSNAQTLLSPWVLKKIEIYSKNKNTPYAEEKLKKLGQFLTDVQSFLGSKNTQFSSEAFDAVAYQHEKGQKIPNKKAEKLRAQIKNLKHTNAAQSTASSKHTDAYANNDASKKFKKNDTTHHLTQANAAGLVIAGAAAKTATKLKPAFKRINPGELERRVASKVKAVAAKTKSLPRESGISNNPTIPPSVHTRVTAQYSTVDPKPATNELPKAVKTDIKPPEIAKSAPPIAKPIPKTSVSSHPIPSSPKPTVTMHAVQIEKMVVAEKEAAEAITRVTAQYPTVSADVPLSKKRVHLPGVVDSGMPRVAEPIVEPVAIKTMGNNTAKIPAEQIESILKDEHRTVKFTQSAVAEQVQKAQVAAEYAENAGKKVPFGEYPAPQVAAKKPWPVTRPLPQINLNTITKPLGLPSQSEPTLITHALDRPTKIMPAVKPQSQSALLQRAKDFGTRAKQLSQAVSKEAIGVVKEARAMRSGAANAGKAVRSIFGAALVLPDLFASGYEAAKIGTIQKSAISAGINPKFLNGLGNWQYKRVIEQGLNIVGAAAKGVTLVTGNPLGILAGKGVDFSRKMVSSTNAAILLRNIFTESESFEELIQTLEKLQQIPDMMEFIDDSAIEQFFDHVQKLGNLSGILNEKVWSDARIRPFVNHLVKKLSTLSAKELYQGTGDRFDTYLNKNERGIKNKVIHTLKFGADVLDLAGEYMSVVDKFDAAALVFIAFQSGNDELLYNIMSRYQDKAESKYKSFFESHDAPVWPLLVGRYERIRSQKLGLK